MEILKNHDKALESLPQFKILLFLFALLLPLKGFSLPWVHVEGYASAGLGESKLGTETESPKMLIYDIGATLGIKVFGGLYVGASYGQQILNQMSDTDKAYGNRQGKKSGISPAVGWEFLIIHLKYEFIKNGDYELDNTTTSSESVAYLDPDGFRATAQITFMPFIKVGVFYEVVDYEKKKINTTETNISSAPMTVKNFGLVLSVIL